ncbi:hypothetical protein [Nonomuraea sp. NPDC052265]|uniref:hypothetical protein n=1 Tax=Nonomuraea sp. NPDC052265 TaxID=3364374 RepID=UPI0037C7CE97
MRTNPSTARIVTTAAALLPLTLPLSAPAEVAAAVPRSARRAAQDRPLGAEADTGQGDHEQERDAPGLPTHHDIGLTSVYGD